MENGLISGIYTDDSALIGREVVIMDMDAEGSDDYVTDEDGRECCPHIEVVESLSTEELTKDLVLANSRHNLDPEYSMTDWEWWKKEGMTELTYDDWVAWRKAGNGEN